MVPGASLTALMLAARTLLFGLTPVLQPAPLHLCSPGHDQTWVPYPSLSESDSCSKVPQRFSLLVGPWGVSVQEGETQSVLMAGLMDERVGVE